MIVPPVFPVAPVTSTTDRDSGSFDLGFIAVVVEVAVGDEDEPRPIFFSKLFATCLIWSNTIQGEDDRTVFAIFPVLPAVQFPPNDLNPELNRTAFTNATVQMTSHGKNKGKNIKCSHRIVFVW